MLGIVFLTPLPFTACSPGSYWCSVAYGFTRSGGPTGFLILLVLTCCCYSVSAPSLKERGLVFLKSFVALAVFFGFLAFINETYTKPILRSQRPSHVYMLKQTGFSSVIDSLYQLDKATRKEFFSALIRSHPNEFKGIDTEVQSHWVEEAGFSFPSGHTFNSFLFAMILSYAIYFNRSFYAWKHLYFIPFLWALMVGISRVALGAHTAFDVCAGAALGVAIGSLFLYIQKTRHWLTRKN